MWEATSQIEILWLRVILLEQIIYFQTLMQIKIFQIIIFSQTLWLIIWQMQTML